MLDRSAMKQNDKLTWKYEKNKINPRALAHICSTLALVRPMHKYIHYKWTYSAQQQQQQQQIHSKWAHRRRVHRHSTDRLTPTSSTTTNQQSKANRLSGSHRTKLMNRSKGVEKVSYVHFYFSFRDWYFKLSHVHFYYLLLFNWRLYSVDVPWLFQRNIYRDNYYVRWWFGETLNFSCDRSFSIVGVYSCCGSSEDSWIRRTSVFVIESIGII